MSSQRLPYIRWFAGDHRADPLVRMCSLAARGLWVDMIGLMHEAQPYGHLLVGGVAPTVDQIASLVATPSARVKKALAELESSKVFSRTSDGVIFSRRMLRDRERAERDRENGRRGGNPRLLGGENHADKPWVNPPDKAHTLAAIAIPATESLTDKSSSLPAREIEKDIRRFGGNSGWADQQQRDGYAVQRCIAFLPGADEGERWAVAAAAEDENSPDHDRAVKLMLAASKQAGVGWISPERRRQRGAA